MCPETVGIVLNFYSHLELEIVRVVEFGGPYAAAEEHIAEPRHIEAHTGALEKPCLVFIDADLAEHIAAHGAENRHIPVVELVKEAEGHIERAVTLAFSHLLVPIDDTVAFLQFIGTPVIDSVRHQTGRAHQGITVRHVNADAGAGMAHEIVFLESGILDHLVVGLEFGFAGMETRSGIYVHTEFALEFVRNAEGLDLFRVCPAGIVTCAYTYGKVIQAEIRHPGITVGMMNPICVQSQFEAFGRTEFELGAESHENRQRSTYVNHSGIVQGIVNDVGGTQAQIQKESGGEPSVLVHRRLHKAVEIDEVAHTAVVCEAHHAVSIIIDAYAEYGEIKYLIEHVILPSRARVVSPLKGITHMSVFREEIRAQVVGIGDECVVGAYGISGIGHIAGGTDADTAQQCGYDEYYCRSGLQSVLISENVTKTNLEAHIAAAFFY